jgi:hypothetical protein
MEHMTPLRAIRRADGTEFVIPGLVPYSAVSDKEAARPQQISLRRTPA